MTLPTALAQSCDTYFYQVGKDFYDLPPDRGQPLQKWAKTFGFGQPTGLDVGPETSGLLPTIKWKQATFTKETDPDNWQIDRIWKSGDSIQLAIGQKDMLASPLQMARFYALLANGGKLVKPHLVSAIEQGGGSTTGPAPGADRPTPLPAAGAGAEPRPGRDRRHPPGPLRGDALAVRDLVRRLRPLPDPDRRQDRDGREGHRRRRRLLPEGEHGVVVRLGAVRVPRARRLRRDRERRLRRRDRRAVRAPGVRAVLRSQGDAGAGGAGGLMVDYAVSRANGHAPARACARGLVPAERRLGPPRRGRRHRRVRPLDGLRDHEGRRHGRPELLRRPPGGLRADRRRRDGRDDPHRPELLAEALPASSTGCSSSCSC